MDENKLVPFFLILVAVIIINLLQYKFLYKEYQIDPLDFPHYYENDLKIYPSINVEYCKKYKLDRTSILKLNGYEKDITVVAQLTFDRISRLSSLQNRWNSYISTVLFLRTSVPLDEFKPEEIIERINFSFPNLILGNNIHFHFVVAHQDLPRYPLNELRNISWKYVTTKKIFILDIDFIPSKNFMVELNQLPKRIMTRLEKKYLVLVFSAWDYACTDLLKEDTCDRVSPTLSDHDSQRSTNITKWIGTNQAYQVEYSLYYEPYFISSVDIPKYDELFTIGHDKTQHTYELAAAGYEFWVMPKAYVAHIPHPPEVSHSLLNKYYSYDMAWTQWTKFVRRIYKNYQGFNMYCLGEQTMNHGNPFIRAIRKFICYL